MSSLLEYEEGDSDRAEFRRGFAHGAQALFDVVGSQLSQGDADTLRRWLNRDIREWTLTGEELGRPPQAPELLPPS
ncbi:hypothetical protein [Methylobacterium gnaphalii]|uniref:Uncharacterized protein n=1 Tax=Methylobacterium gnaphalii TaxID=1010610 RepID=A0A512JMH9_9HYPH|nr:hypothetical protein [Methylobacterium gnaphalii]GEP11134.1 hypothetical protein MGN01_29790 [Methylobacterium gnaphalii]GJD71790.1 hypothetical protein MMMDOFMJ_4755 [Methylobacterium gnaphalii]GLS49639.1 hypothetical protein GCM10007885_24890 [Methylobacterium gnaphalii]